MNLWFTFFNGFEIQVWAGLRPFRYTLSLSINKMFLIEVQANLDIKNITSETQKSFQKKLISALKKCLTLNPL